jgi:hypothetical protein
MFHHPIFPRPLELLPNQLQIAATDFAKILQLIFAGNAAETNFLALPFLSA